MNQPSYYQTNGGTEGASQAPAKPAWLAPAVVVTLVAVVYFGSKKKNDVSENALVDILILTIGVLAFAHVLKWSAVKLGSPGLARFFSLPAPSSQEVNN